MLTPDSAAPAAAGGCVTVETVGNGFLGVGSKVMAKFYEDGSMNAAVIRGLVERAGLQMYQCEFVGYEDDGVQVLYTCVLILLLLYLCYVSS
jgi:hypothetical protein